jgi:raffinose/stachyose/melibiose transport system substrate-binding protein
MKKLFTFLLAIGLVLALVGCGGGDGDKTVINFWHLYVDETQAERITIEKFIKEFQAANPGVKVVQHPLQDADYKNKLYTEFTGNAESVDVFTYWAAGRAGEIVKNGKMLCIEEYLSADQIGKLKQGVTLNFTYDGKLYGVPTYSWMMVLYCNTEIFEKYNQPIPETFDQLLAACKVFAAAGVEPIALGGGQDDAWQTAFIVEAMVNRFLGAAGEDAMLNGGPGRETDMFKKAAEAVVALNKAGAFGTSPLEESEDRANTIFLSGGAAMRLTGSWFTGGVYTDEDSVVEGKVTAIPVPSVTGGKGLATDYKGGFIDGIFVNNATANPELCATFAYELAATLADTYHSSGNGFTAFNIPVDESGLSDLGKEVAEVASTKELGIVAWDTFLDQDIAEIHLMACQQLLKDNDVAAFIKAYAEVFK